MSLKFYFKIFTQPQYFYVNKINYKAGTHIVLLDKN